MSRAAAIDAALERRVDANFQAETYGASADVSLRQRGRGNARNLVRAAIDALSRGDDSSAVRVIREELTHETNEARRAALVRSGSNVLCSFAELYQRPETVSGALDFLREEIQRSPDWPDLHNALGCAQLLRGRLNASTEAMRHAVDAFRVARALADKTGPAFLPRVMVNQGIALSEFAALDKAEPDDPRLAEAAQILDEARSLLRATPDSEAPLPRDIPQVGDLRGSIEDALGSTRLMQGRLGTAFIHFRKALGAYPPNARREAGKIYNNMGLVYARAYRSERPHRLEKAIDAYVTALAKLDDGVDDFEWSRAQCNYSGIFVKKALLSQTSKSSRRELLEHAITHLREARGRCFFPARQVEIDTDIQSMRLLIKYYDSISDENVINFGLFLAKKENYSNIMDRQSIILPPIRSVLLQHRVTRHEWLAVATAINVEFADKNSELARQAGIPEEEPRQSVPPMPTTEELERAGRLYSQAFSAAEQEGRKYNIIDHLRAVWMPFIEGGVLTRPILRQAKGSAYGDLSAYDALRRWEASRDEGALQKVLGHDIPKNSTLVDRRIAESAALPPGERPTRDNRAHRYRLQKEQKSDRGRVG